MDKNLAALLREDTRTVKVRFTDIWSGVVERDEAREILRAHADEIAEIRRRVLAKGKDRLNAEEAEEADRLITLANRQRDGSLSALESKTYKPPETKLYTYVADGDTVAALANGSIVVVLASGKPSLARVTAIDDGCKIEPNSDMQFGWIIDVVDTTRYDALMVKNAEIEAKVAEVYRTNLRKSFRAQILGDLSDDGRLQIESLLK